MPLSYAHWDKHASSMSALPHFEQAFQSVGWFIPPYVQMGFLSRLAGKILSSPQPMSTDAFEAELSQIYAPSGLAAMVIHRYPIVPILSEYRQTIGEAIEAHFMGLHHVAATGLVPVVEGAGRRLLESRIGQPVASKRPTKDVILELAAFCKVQSRAGNGGDSGEVGSMMDSFTWFAKNVLFADSATHGFLDNTNRHGMAHGAYRDADYGRPINFYKIMAAIEFLAFASSFTANVSWLAPDPTEQSEKLALFYLLLGKVGENRPTASA